MPSADLPSAVHAGQLDVAVAEELLGLESGETLAVERLVWVGARGGRAHGRTPLPLSLVAETCAFRAPVLSALAKAGHASRTVFESGGLEASRTAVRMDLAVSAWLESTVPGDLAILPPDSGLPALPSFAISLHVAPATRGAAVHELARHLRASLAPLRMVA